MKKLSKMITILSIVLTILTIATSVFAVGPSPKNYTGDASAVNVNSITDIGNSLIKVVSTIGSVISVIVLVILGIKYMMGSAEEKADYKKTLIIYIIGAALVFAASTIATVVFNFASTINVK